MEKYSVLMSVYYREDPMYFRQAMESMLNQSVKPSEVVLICDGELTPELDAVIDELYAQNEDLFHIIRFEKNRGLGFALQAGVEACSYDLIARMDTDDIALPDRLEKQLKVMEQNPQVSVVGGQIAEFIHSTDEIVSFRIVPQSAEEIRERAKKRNPMNHMTVLYRKADVLAAGNYQDLKYYEDYYLWARMLAKGYQMCNIGDICCHVRVGNGMYQRRGGKEYFHNALELERRLLGMKLINKREYIQNVIVRYVGAVLINGKMREFLFKKLMRTQKADVSET